jgi:hypothetical protein
VKLKKFNSDGALQLTRTIAGGAGTEQDPSVSMDALGNMVVAYERFFGADVHANARRVSSAGELGGEIFVGNFFNRDSTDPEVALSNSGAFVVAFNFARPDDSNAVRVTEVGADDFIRAGAEHIIETPGQATFGPSVSIDGSGRYFVTYQRNNAGDLNVFGQRGQLE